MWLAECGEKSAESGNDPETRDSEALIKKGDGLCSAPGDDVMRHASRPARVSLSHAARLVFSASLPFLKSSKPRV